MFACDIKNIADADEEKVIFKQVEKNETGDGVKRATICRKFTNGTRLPSAVTGCSFCELYQQTSSSSNFFFSFLVCRPVWETPT